MPKVVLTASSGQDDTITVEVYKPSQKGLWNDFIANAKNGVFLFNRDYMEYHSERFEDHSLLFYRSNRLVAVLPANLDKSVLHSHGGLTFGGIISSYKMKTHIMLSIFNKLVKHCQDLGVSEIVYKPIPYIYHSIPADEDLYALFAHNARLMARNISSCIYLPNARKFNDNRLDNIRKAKKNGITVKECTDFRSFMEIEQANLEERHGVKPVHSVAEIELLAKRFPDNIRLFASFKDSSMLAGVIMYESKNVAHMQYASNSKEGWSLGAQDIIEDYLINGYYKEKSYFDFGISTEKLGQYLNEGLIKRKEDFGASAVMYDLYHLAL